MASSNSATEPKSNPSEKFAFRLRASLFGAHRRSCCASSIPGPSEKPVVHDGGHVGSGATSDEIEEHLKWVAEWIDSSKSPATSSPLRLGQISGAAASLLAEDLIAGMTAGERVQRDPGVSLRDSRAPVREAASLKPFQASRPPTLDSTPVRLLARRSWMAWVGGLGTIMLLPTVIGFLVMDLPVSRFSQGQADDSTFDLASSSSRFVRHESSQRNELEPRLVAQKSRGLSGEPIPLGLTLSGSAPGSVVVIAGLVPGMTLSNGSAVRSDTWQVPGTDLANTWIGPPQGFVGVVKLEAELHLPDRTTIAHQESVHAEWIAAGPSRSDSMPIASARADSEQGPIPTDPSDSDQTRVASTPADSEQVPNTTGPSDSAPTPIAPARADSEQEPIATGPSDSESVSIASARADSEQVPIAIGPSDSDQTRVASIPADSEQEPTATDPSGSDQTRVASTPADSEHGPIAAGPAGPEQVSVTEAPLKVFPAPQLLDHDETATEVSENSVARSEQHAASGHDKPLPRSRPSAREFIDANGFVHIILPRWQSEPMADTRSVKQVIGGTLPPSGPRDLMSQDDVPFAALHGNKLEQEASYPRLEHKSKASNATSSRQIAKNRSRQKQLAVKSQPAKRAIPSPRKPSISPSSNTSRPSVILFPASAGSPARFPPGFHRRGPPLPIVFFRPPMVPLYLPGGRL